MKEFHLSKLRYMPLFDETSLVTEGFKKYFFSQKRTDYNKKIMVQCMCISKCGCFYSKYYWPFHVYKASHALLSHSAFSWYAFFYMLMMNERQENCEETM